MIQRPDRRAVAVYRRWHRLQVATGDLDPTYEVYRRVVSVLGLDRQQAAWLVLAHVVWYDTGQAMRAFRLTDGSVAGVDDRLEVLSAMTRTGVERRAHRDGRQLRAHLLSLREATGDDPAGWLTSPGSWEALTARLMEVYGNGRWAAYKTAEMAQKVLGVDVQATDAGHAHSSGPRQGLGLLVSGLPTGNGPRDVAVLDEWTWWLQQQVGEPDVAQVETSLCDFHSLVRGRYYLGHDIDGHLEQALRADPADRDVLMEARSQAFAPEYLGEKQGWTGVDKARKRVFAADGVIVER